MAAPAPPTVPPRPGRAQQAAAAGASHLPEIPPRPKRFDRSTSPANYPGSPLNESPFGGNITRLKSNDPSSLSLPPRPPSVQNLPSVGQEGNEYENIYYHSPGLPADAAAQTRSVAEDLKLHAPKPSLPLSSAKAQVQAVTRTDSHSAASLGFGKPGTPNQDESEPLRQVRTRTSFSRPESQASTERRRSVVYGEDQGPEAIGLRVPINPQLGDVQAPSPAPFGSALTPSHTGHHGENKRRHSRTKSGREVFLPPGSYGLHGHGVIPQDKFEKDWYAKHPEQLQHEEAHGHGVYESIGSGRGNYALSSDDLNKIVRNTASRGAGFGTNPSTVSYPDEQIGYLASEQYTSRSQVASPNYLTKVQSNSSQPANESPLRKTSFPADDIGTHEFRRSKGSLSGKSDDVVESENEEPIHVDEPRRKYNKITGGEGRMRETEEARPYVSHPTEHGGMVDEHGYSVPILASDEVAKEGNNEHMHPAVSPKQDRRSSQYDYEARASGEVTPSSRPGSRPGSIYGMYSGAGLSNSLSRFAAQHEEHRESMHTPLEDVDEYEPLFAEEDSTKKALSTAERFKQRPDVLKHRFPSQDIWEDTPRSVMYEATVSTPDLPAQREMPTSSDVATTFEHPDVDAKRKGEPSEEEKKKLVPAEERLAKSRFAPHLRDDMPTRPGMQPRFPSQDIWEDSPDSQHLVTTVQDRSDEEETTSPTETVSKPTIPPRPTNRSKLSDENDAGQMAPSIPARPSKRMLDSKANDAAISDAQSSTKEPAPTEIRKVPSIPDRPKPQIPPRPAKTTSIEGLSKTISASSAISGGSIETDNGVPVTSPTATKVKPQVPARPIQGSKLAGLKGNFMNDLNQKLGLGPPKEKAKEPEPEPEQDAKPLEDARKGRARGPQRRAPAKSPSVADMSTAKPTPFSMSVPIPLWHISSDDGLLNVHSHPAGNAVESGSLPSTLEDSASTARPPEEISPDSMSRMESSTVAESPPASTVDTKKPEKSVESESMPKELEQLTADTTQGACLAAEATHPPAVPAQEKPNPSDRTLQESGGDVSLSKRTNASSGAISGHELERAELDPNTDTIPSSQHTTADPSVSGGTLEKVESEAEAEGIKLRHEQVSAPAPGPVSSETTSSSRSAGFEGESMKIKDDSVVQQIAAGADKPREPMNEEDVSYKNLEEMTAQADGKGHAPEEDGTQKVVE